MATYKTEGIILRRSNFGEADRILTVYTENYGKLRAIAKAVRRPTAKLAGSLELFYRSKLRLAQGKNLDIIIESQPINLYRKIGEDLDRYHLVSYLAELVDKTIQEEQNHPGIYKLLVECLDFIDKKGAGNPMIAQYFLLRLLAELGYTPQVEVCTAQHESLLAGRNFWSSSQGGVVCAHHRGQAWRAAPIRDNTVKLIRLMLKRSISQITQIEIPRQIQDETRRIIDDFFNYHFDINLKSERYVKLA